MIRERSEYAKNLEDRVRGYYDINGDETDVIVVDGDSICGVYVDYRLVCTDVSVDVFLAVEECGCDDKYREAMWAMLADEAATHGFPKEATVLKDVPDSFLIEELRRRGRLF